MVRKTVMTAIAARAVLLCLLSLPGVAVVQAFVVQPSSSRTGASTVTTSSSWSCSTPSRPIQQSSTRAASETALQSSLPFPEGGDENENEDDAEGGGEEEARSAVKEGAPPSVEVFRDDATAAAAVTSQISVETGMDQMADLQVQTLDEATVTVGDLMASVGAKTKSDVVVVSCLSHFGDFNAWELTQQYMAAVKGGRLDGDCQVILVGIGSVQSANTFARDIGLMDDPLYRDRITLVTDETGRITEALQCYRGWLTVDPKHRERYPQTDMDPSLKLLGMIIGLGSPGTIPSVIEGYTGDVSQKYGPFGRRWVVQALRQGNDKGRFPRVQVAVDDGGPKKVLRPFELATLRLQTGLHIVSKWSKLGPKDGELFTRMGGTFIFSGTECIWEHFDRGILNFANMDDICQVADAAAQGGRYVPPTNIRSAQESRQRFWATKDEEAKRRDEEEVRLAEEARLVRERQAEEARLADEARLEELDRIEQARITEMALQGQEAKRKRLEEEERNAQKTLMIEEADRAGADEAKRASEAAAKKVAEEEKASIEATEQEEAAKTSLEAPTMLASEQEAADRIACDEAQMIKVQEEMVGAEEAHGMEAKVDDETVVVETAEDSAARVIAAVSDVEPDAETAASEQSGFTDERTESLDPLDAAILKAEEQEKNLWASLEALKSAPRSDAESSTKEEDKAGKDQREAFQRRMLAARIHYESALTEVAPDGEAAASEVAGTANILSGRKTKTASAPQESFQRSLLKARLQYEAATRLAEVKSDMKHEYAVIASYDDGEISVGVEPDGTVNDDIVESEAPRSHNGVELQKEQEKFQRNLLSARLHYEQSTPSHSKSTEDEEEENENEESPSSEFFALSPDEAFS